MKYARIENEAVVEIGEFDSIKGRFHPSLEWAECPANVTVGWSYRLGNGGDLFAAPVTKPAAVPEHVTMAQARLALLQSGLLSQVEAAVVAAGEAAKIQWEYSTVVRRNSDLVLALSAGLGLTSAQLDDLFRLAATL